MVQAWHERELVCVAGFRLSINLVLAHNLALEAELRRTVGALARESIHVIVLKGVPLVRRPYGRLDARPITDNDLLVRRRDAAKARDVFVAPWKLSSAATPSARWCGRLRRA